MDLGLCKAFLRSINNQHFADGEKWADGIAILENRLLTLEIALTEAIDVLSDEEASAYAADTQLLSMLQDVMMVDNNGDEG